MNSIPSPASAESPRRPYWLTEQCPEWCTADHRADDAPEDRVHFPDWQGSVDLTLMSFTPAEVALHAEYEAAVPGAVFVPFAQVYVSRNVGETETRISVSLNDNPSRGWEMTPDEAYALIARLTEAVEVADGFLVPKATRTR